MLAAVLLASTSPAAAYISSAHEHALVFNASLRLGMAGGFLAITLAFYRGETLREIRYLANNPRLLLQWGPATVIVATADYLLYALATRHINPAAAVALMETWPAMIIVTGSLATRGTGRYRLQPGRAALAGAAAVTGAALIIASQEGSLGSLIPSQRTAGTLLGAALALGAGLTLAPVPLAIRWCETTAATRDRTKAHLPVLYIGVLNAAASLAASGLYTVAATATGERTTAAAVVFPLACGLLTQAAGALAWRVANHLTDQLNLNLILFGLPAPAQTWIWLLGGLSAARLDYLLLGTALVAAANAGAAVRLGRRARKRSTHPSVG